MKQFKLSVSSRSAVGTLRAGRLRRAGQVPAVIYGKKSASRPLAIEESALRVLMRQVGSSLAIIEVDENGKKALALLQEVKRHPTNDRLLHVDFHEICPEDSLHIHVPVHTVGVCPGVIVENGNLNVVLHSLDVKALPKDLPSSIDIDISNLHLGQSIHVSELPVLPGVTYLAAPDQVVVACMAPVVVEAPVEVVEADATPVKAGGKPAAKAAPAKPAAKK